MWLDEPGSPVWAPASNPPTSHHSLSEGAYLDDAVYFTAAAMPVGLFSSLASFAGVVFEAMVQHMLTLNLKRGKTEAVVCLPGKGKELAFSMGINLSISRLGSVINDVASTPLASASSSSRATPAALTRTPAAPSS